MNIKDFKSGVYLPQFNYKSFSPAKVNFEWIWDDPKINILLEEANIKLGELNAFSLYVPDIDIFIYMHVLKEATTSSKIEGTKTEISDAVLKAEEITQEKKDDWGEVQNYVVAMNSAIEELKSIPLSTRVLKNAHKNLLHGVRGEHKTPGEFRTSQNWIGGASIKDAVFIPPVHNEVNELMSDLELFLHNNKINVPHLIKIAIGHYQFETIHPFLDGNGRLGRLLITLYLVSESLLHKPTLYLSEFFERNKSLYYDNLTFVRTANKLDQWIKFFLVAVIETSKKGIFTFKEILKLKEKIESEKIITLGKKVFNAKLLLNQLYKNPVVSSNDIKTLLNISTRASNGLLNDFIRLGILEEITGFKRNRLFSFKEYLNLFN
jgi:Fic family protein